MFKATQKPPETNLNTLAEGVIRGKGFSIDQVPSGNQAKSAAYVTIRIDDNRKVQFYIRERTDDYSKIRLYYRFIINGEVTEWNQMVLEHENLKTGDGLTTSFNTDETTIMFKATNKPPETNLNTLAEGVIRGKGFSIDQVPNGNQAKSAAYVTIRTGDNRKVQLHIRESGVENAIIRLYYRFIINGEVTEWKQMAGDWGELNNLLEQKQNTLTSNTSIGVSGNTSTLRQLYALNKTYTHTNGVLKTHVKSVSSNTSVDTAEEEFNFTLKINQGQQSATFTLNEHDKTKFNNIITAYGTGNTVRINGCLFTLSDATLTVSTEENTGSNYLITFSDII